METVQALIVQHLRVAAAETGGAAFERFLGADDQYYFHLRAANGEIVLQSEGYVAKAGADNGIASVRENGKLVEQYEIIEAQNGQHYFVLKALNHEIIGRGEMYVSLYNAERAVDSIVELLQSEAVADPE
ncbi:MAG: YegP family protein [Deltaproteobacteria bacterium]|nr:YegP family protein [Deltaproteobacteria bacterium]